MSVETMIDDLYKEYGDTIVELTKTRDKVSELTLQLFNAETENIVLKNRIELMQTKINYLENRYAPGKII